MPLTPLTPGSAPGLLSLAAGGAHGSPAVLPMVLIALVMLGTFVLIAFEVLHKTVAALLGAIVAVALALAFGVYEGYEAVHHFIEHDLGVLGVIVGTSILVAIASHSGLFHFVAVRLIKLTRGDPKRILPAIMTATIAFVTFLTIAPAALIMASLVLVISDALDDDPKPYMIAVAIAANSGAMMTFASGIPTLMIGTSADIPYVHFLIVSAPLAFLSAFVAYLVLRFHYRNSLRADASSLAERAAKVRGFDEWALVRDRRLFVRSAIILALTIVGFSTARVLGVGLDFVAIAGGTAALLFSGFDVDEAIKKVKWPVIMFFVGLFVLIGTVQSTGLLELVAGRIHGMSGGDSLVATMILIPMSAGLAGVVDNIPVAATMIPVVHSMTSAGLEPEPLWWGLIAACNLGGNPTPVGSIAAVIALSALEKERGIRVGWGEYMKVGIAITVLQVILTIGYIAVFARFDLFPTLG